MSTELITKRRDLLIRRLVLEPGEATPWHTDACHRFSVVVRGAQLTLQFADGAQEAAIPVYAGLASWDAPTDRVHRALNTGKDPYEEVVIFFLDAQDVEPQPEAQPASAAAT